MQTFEFRVFADYNQFYLHDAEANLEVGDFSDEDIARMLIARPRLVVVEPLRNNTVPVHLAIALAPPANASDDWDHVVECSLEITSGQLAVSELGGNVVMNAKVQPGWYRVRAQFRGLGTLSADGLRGQDEYHLVLWKQPKKEALRVIKRWG